MEDAKYSPLPCSIRYLLTSTTFFCVTHMRFLEDLAALEKHINHKSRFGNFLKQYEHEKKVRSLEKAQADQEKYHT